MNLYLLTSSVLTGICIVNQIVWKYTVRLQNIYLLFLTGIVTSLANHGTNSLWWKRADRLTIGGTAFLLFCHIWLQKEKDTLNQLLAATLISFAVWCFFFSKCVENESIRVSIHSCAHWTCVFLLDVLHG